MYVEVAVTAQKDIVINLTQDLKLLTTDLIILTLDQELGLSLYIATCTCNTCVLVILHLYIYHYNSDPICYT